MKAPRSCQTCVHMATHEKCNGCLLGKDNKEYGNWEFGDWLSRVLEHEKAGKRSIVIGGQGEAEVNAKDTPAQASKHLHYVAEQCGYMCGNLVHTLIGGTTSLTIWTTEGRYRITWNTADKDEAGKLDRIDRVEEGAEPVLSWPDPPPANWEVLWATEVGSMDKRKEGN